jgi:hypothetical protein
LANTPFIMREKAAPKPAGVFHIIAPRDRSSPPGQPRPRSERDTAVPRRGRRRPRTFFSTLMTRRPWRCQRGPTASLSTRCRCLYENHSPFHLPRQPKIILLPGPVQVAVESDDLPRQARDEHEAKRCNGAKKPFFAPRKASFGWPLSNLKSPAEKTTSFLNFSSCLFRACLGKMIVV